MLDMMTAVLTGGLLRGSVLFSTQCKHSLMALFGERRVSPQFAEGKFCMDV